jgi:hypothetical protein
MRKHRSFGGPDFHYDTARKLLQHRRVALERMYDPQTRRELEKMS